MALQTIRIGSAADVFQYDDVAFASGIACSGPMSAGAPVAASDVVRLSDVGGVAGDVIGPAASTDNAIARFHLATGKIIQNSVVTVSDTGIVNIPTGQGYQVNSIQVITDQQAAEADITSGAITDPADAPATADILRDDLVANALVEIAANFAALDTKINNLLAKLRTHGIIAT